MTLFKPQSNKENDKMTKVTKQARFRGRKLANLFAVGIVLCAAVLPFAALADTWYLRDSGSSQHALRSIVLTNMTYWGARDGTASGRTDRPTESDHLVVADGKAGLQRQLPQKKTEQA